jgi:ABC-type uncharacterized transport system substrate-binding protein
MPLVALQPDLILSQSTPTTAALLQETRIIPIVFAIVADPVGSGFVARFNFCTISVVSCQVPDRAVSA